MTPEIEKRIKLVKAGKVPAGYKKTRIGVVPEEWRIGDLSEVLELTLREVEKPSKPYWRVGVRSWAKGTFRAYVDDPSSVDMDTLYQVKENDLVVSITFAWEHAIALATKDDDGLLVSHRFPTYVFKKNHLPIFYQKFVSQPIFKYMLELVSPGGAGRNRVLDKKNFIKLPCPILKFKEQEKIAEILAAQDRVIELKEKLIAEKQKQKRCLMHRLLIKDYSLKRFNKIVLNGICIDKNKWSRKRLEEIAKMSSGSTPRRDCKDNFNGSVQWLSSGELKQKYIVDTEEKLSKDAVRQSNLRIYKPGTFVIAMYGLEAVGIRGTCSIIQTDCTISQACMAFTELKDVINEYLYYWYLLNGQVIGVKYAQGSKQQNLNSDLMGKIIVDLPTLPEQQAIAKVLSAADEEISLLQKDLEQEKLKKKSLMQLLLTGLVRVSA
ncbi:restriction endonuclease subunit S [Fibrobacter sp.]|uniref:restriction endonuclease subunit S n=1 Tax=Fibrobacter sp. TaxID=35828 RepID=UPI00388D90A2